MLSLARQCRIVRAEEQSAKQNMFHTRRNVHRRRLVRVVFAFDYYFFLPNVAAVVATVASVEDIGTTTKLMCEFRGPPGSPFAATGEKTKPLLCKRVAQQNNQRAETNRTVEHHHRICIGDVVMKRDRSAFEESDVLLVTEYKCDATWDLSVTSKVDRERGPFSLQKLAR